MSFWGGGWVVGRAPAGGRSEPGPASSACPPPAVPPAADFEAPHPAPAPGGTRLDGAIPTNTGGGQLSGFYATGFTAVVEGLRQIRGEGGATQVPDAGVALVSGHGGNGGIQNTWAHATLVLGADR